MQYVAFASNAKTKTAKKVQRYNKKSHPINCMHIKMREFTLKNRKEILHSIRFYLISVWFGSHVQKKLFVRATIRSNAVPHMKCTFSFSVVLCIQIRIGAVAARTLHVGSSDLQGSDELVLRREYVCDDKVDTASGFSKRRHWSFASFDRNKFHHLNGQLSHFVCLLAFYVHRKFDWPTRMQCT